MPKKKIKRNITVWNSTGEPAGKCGLWGKYAFEFMSKAEFRRPKMPWRRVAEKDSISDFNMAKVICNELGGVYRIIGCARVKAIESNVPFLISRLGSDSSIIE